MSENTPEEATKLLGKIIGKGAIKDQRLRFLLYTMTIVVLVALPVSIFTLSGALRLVVFIVCVVAVCFLASIIFITDRRRPVTQIAKAQSLSQTRSRVDGDNLAAVVKVMGTKGASIARTGPGGRVEVTDSENIDIQDTGHKQ